MRILHDISPRLHPGIAVWPGDEPFRRHVGLSLEGGANIELSALQSTVHLGAHADAPNHYRVGAAAIDEVDLGAYLGPCRVIHAPGRALLDLDLLPQTDGAERILFRTDSFPDPDQWREDFTAFAPAFVAALGQRGVQLVGLDTPSVDPFHSKDLPAHQELANHQVRNLEGLLLNEVPAGDYLLVALPLRLAEFDASPVRAVLCELAK